MDIFLKVFEECYRSSYEGKDKDFASVFMEIFEQFGSNKLEEKDCMNAILAIPYIKEDVTATYQLRGSFYSSVVETLVHNNISFFKGMAKTLIVKQIACIQIKRSWSELYVLASFMSSLSHFINANSRTYETLKEMQTFLILNDGKQIFNPFTSAYINRTRSCYKHLVEFCKLFQECSWLLLPKDLNVVRSFVERSDNKQGQKDTGRTLFVTNSVTDMSNILNILIKSVTTLNQVAKEINLSIYSTGIKDYVFTADNLHENKYFLNLLNCIAHAMQIRANSLGLKVDCVRIHKKSLNSYVKDLRLISRYRELDPKNDTIGHFNALSSLYKLEELEKLLNTKRKIGQILASKDEPKSKAKKIRNSLKVFDKKLEAFVQSYSTF